MFYRRGVPCVRSLHLKSRKQMEKKTYTTPEIEVIDLPEQTMLLQTSGSGRSLPTDFSEGEFN